MIIKIDGNNRIEIDEGVMVIENIEVIKLLSPDYKNIKEYFLNKFLKDNLDGNLNQYRKYVQDNIFKLDNLLDMFKFLDGEVITYNIKDYINPDLKGDDLKYSVMVGDNHDSAVNKIIDWRGYWAFADDSHEFRYYKDHVMYYLVLNTEGVFNIREMKGSVL